MLRKGSGWVQGLRGGSAEVLSQRRDSPCQGGRGTGRGGREGREKGGARREGEVIESGKCERR